MSIDTGVDPENSERGPAGTLTSYKVDTTGLLRFRGKKSKISRDFQGQIRGKISRFSREKSQNSRKNRPISREISGGNFAEKQSVKTADFAGFFGGKFS